MTTKVLTKFMRVAFAASFGLPLIFAPNEWLSCRLRPFRVTRRRRRPKLRLSASS